MGSLSDSRQGLKKSLHRAYPLRFALALFLFAGAGADSQVVLRQKAAPPVPAKAEPVTSAEAPAEVIHDPLGRETPRGAMMGLLRSGAKHDFATGALYLQSPPKEEKDLAELAKELQALRSRFKGNIALLSNDPEGTPEPGLPPGHVRAGVLSVGEVPTDVILVRVDDPTSGKIWLVSDETVAKIPRLYTQMQNEGPAAIERIEPAALKSRHLLGLSLSHWIGWLLSIPVSWALAWLLTFFLSLPRRVWCKFRKHPFVTVWDTPLATPLKVIFAISIHAFFVYQLNLPLLYQTYYSRFVAGLLAACFIWFVSRIVDRGFDHVVERTRTQRSGGESLLIMVQRLTHILMIVLAILAAMALFGLDVKTALSGLGIAGLAVALAAQKSLENVIGGVSLLMDRAVSVGDVCQIGDRTGVVEDIGLRSLRLRTLDQNLLFIPNGSLAQMQFENLSTRKKLLINQKFLLRIETEVEQLRAVLTRVQNMLDQDPLIELGSSRVRVESFVGAAFEVELFAYAKTGDWAGFAAIRQGVLLKIAEIVEASGTSFASSTQLIYLSSVGSLDKVKTGAVVTRLNGTKASDSFRVPG